MLHELKRRDPLFQENEARYNKRTIKPVESMMDRNFRWALLGKVFTAEIAEERRSERDIVPLLGTSVRRPQGLPDC
jgi:hypothetical protein